MKIKNFAFLLPLAAGVFWGLTGIFVRILNDMNFNNAQITFFRCFFTALALFIYFLLTARNRLKINPKDLWCFFGTGVLSVFAFSLCYFFTLMHSSISVAVILTYTAPFFVVILSAVLFSEKITTAKTIALIMATLGCYLLCKTDKNVPITPIVITFGLLSGLTYALYSIFARFVVDKYPPLVITLYTFIFATATSALSVDFKALGTAVSGAPSCIFILILFASVSALVPYTLLTIGLKYIDSGKASILTTTEVMTASLCGILFFGEKITAAGILGIILILAAVVIINIKSFSKNF